MLSVIYAILWGLLGGVSLCVGYIALIVLGVMVGVATLYHCKVQVPVELIAEPDQFSGPPFEASCFEAREQALAQSARFGCPIEPPAPDDLILASLPPKRTVKLRIPDIGVIVSYTSASGKEWPAIVARVEWLGEAESPLDLFVFNSEVGGSIQLGIEQGNGMNEWRFLEPQGVRFIEV